MRQSHSTQANQRCLTADLRAPRESDCSRTHSKVSSDCLPSYNKATPPVLEIFKIDGYFPDSPLISADNVSKECCRTKGSAFHSST